jgi:erythromycin esterase
MLKIEGVDMQEMQDFISETALELDSPADLQPLIDRIGNARIVMLGEASHGTHEFYTWRAHISKRLIQEKGFSFIAVEGDWPDCYKLNRFIKGYDNIESVEKILHSFDRWPTWMWANWEMVAFAGWLKKFNRDFPASKRIGFYGLDVYSLWESMESIREYLLKHDPEALKIAEEAYRCFEPFRKEEGAGYAKATRFVPDLCRDEVINLLREIKSKHRSWDNDHENAFSAEQNALISVNAERYYRSMIEGGPECWNIRDRHMAETLDRLLKFHGRGAKAIVWAHNTHIGDARATDMADDGMFNLGELARTDYNVQEVVLVGFGSYSGTVLAGRSWGAPMGVMELPGGIRNSWEDLLHKARGKNLLLMMDELATNSLFMERRLGHRAVGVVYHPEYEKGNYVPSQLPLRYDAFIHIDETTALHPLHMDPDGHKVPETFPFGV